MTKTTKESPLTAAFLGEYSDNLPLELRRNYTLIRQLDDNAEELMYQVEKETMLITTSGKDLSPEERKKKLEHISNLLKEVINKGEEKYALAKSTYDSVDRHCTKLDNDLERIEAEQQLLEPTHRMYEHAQYESIKPSQGESRRGRKKKTNEEDYSSDDLQKEISFSNMPIDPNEPRYCYCQRVSFGEMVACDNPGCEIEWFHYECVGLDSRPKGAWFCKHCAVTHSTTTKKKQKH
ncbi:Putative Yng2p [Rhizopus microsporus]|nr:Putative Yng2p [Rhizopus microsporus]